MNRYFVFCLPLLLACSSTKNIPEKVGQNTAMTIEQIEKSELNFTQVSVLFRPPAPAYPPEAKAVRAEGMVVIEIVVGPDGVPTDAKALSGPQELRKASEDYCLEWRFTPAKLNRVPQYARFKMSLPWRLK